MRKRARERESEREANTGGGPWTIKDGRRVLFGKDGSAVFEELDEELDHTSFGRCAVLKAALAFSRRDSENRRLASVLHPRHPDYFFLFFHDRPEPG